MVRQAILLGDYSENQYSRITLVFRRETAFKKPIMLPNRSVTRYAYSEVCSLLFVWLLWDLNRILTLNTLPPYSAFMFAQWPARRRLLAHPSSLWYLNFGTLGLSGRRLVRISFAPVSLSATPEPV